MTANEKAEALVTKINQHLEAGGVVQVTTYLRSVAYRGAKYAGMFRANGNHVEAQRGRRSWESIRVFYDGDTESGCSIRFGRYVAA
jgi:hypothetical protein